VLIYSLALVIVSYCSVYSSVSIMEPDRTSGVSEGAYETHYCSVAEAMKLITHPFDGDKKRLREFIENADSAFELVHPRKHEILLKFIDEDYRRR
jgi:hypothetical protein